MDFTSPFLPNYLSWFFNISSLILSALLIIKINWLTLLKNKKLNVWLTSIFLLSLIWMMRASLNSGLNVHLLGSMLITLMFGWRLGILAMTLVCILVSLWGHSAFFNLGFAILINAYFSVSICYLFFLIIEAFLPRNLYIYLYLSAFFGSALNFILTGTVSVIFLGLFNAYEWHILLNDYLPFYYLMSFAEAFVTCGLVTLFVVYRPQWVYSFRDERYLQDK